MRKTTLILFLIFTVVVFSNAQTAKTMSGVIVKNGMGATWSYVVLRVGNNDYGVQIDGNNFQIKQVGNVWDVGSKVQVFYTKVDNTFNYDNISTWLKATRLVELKPAKQVANLPADKSWQAFWALFSTAIRKRDKVSIKRLMSSEADFSSGGGSENRDEWLKMIDDSKVWGRLQKSIEKGTAPYNEDNRIGRITKDRVLIFQVINNKWRFVGVMGD